MKVLDILNDIDIGGIALPTFQRGYVWNRERVINLMNSLYREWPAGGLLVWRTSAENVVLRPDGTAPPSSDISMLLDGQQRVTSLYGIMRGKPPKFFDGNAQAFTNLRFDLETEEFRFYNPKSMVTRPQWISVTDLFLNGPAQVAAQVAANTPDPAATLGMYLERANRLYQIRDKDFPVELVSGDDKTTAIVVEIFNAVNSGGRTLSRGDLSLARIGSKWSEARSEMQQPLVKWEKSGFKHQNPLDWMLRCVVALVANAAEVEQLDDKQVDDIKQAVQDTEQAIDALLEATGKYLGMDGKSHSNKNAFPAMVKYLINNSGDFPDDAAKARILHWYVSASLRGRHSGPVDTIINQDLADLAEPNPILALLERERIRLGGEREVTPEDFDAVRTNARFYLMRHIMPRVWGARDWMARKQIFCRLSELEPDTKLQWHHIFPKAVLRDCLGITGEAANNFGNLALITAEANQAIGNQKPEKYLRDLKKIPGVLESQWVPTEPELWKMENYERFLEERRRLMADAANELLNSLRDGILPSVFVGTADDSVDADSEDAILAELNDFVVANGLPSGELGYEIADASTGDLIATLDLAWPNGLQDGLSEPLTVLVGEESLVLKAAGKAGFKVFTDEELEDFRRYVLREILGEDEEEMASAAD